MRFRPVQPARELICREDLIYAGSDAVQLLGVLFHPHCDLIK